MCYAWRMKRKKKKAPKSPEEQAAEAQIMMQTMQSYYLKASLDALKRSMRFWELVTPSTCSMEEYIEYAETGKINGRKYDAA